MEIERDAEGFAHFVSPTAPKLKLTMPADPEVKNTRRTLIQFENGSYKTDDERVIKFFADCLEEGGDLGRYVQSVQFQTAERIAKAHQQSQLAKEQVVKGTTSSAHLSHELQKNPERRVEIEQMTQNPEEAARVAAELEQSDLTMTQKVDQSAAIEAALADEAAAKEAKEKPAIPGMPGQKK